MARLLFISLWNLLPMSNRPMQISCRWFFCGHLDVHCRKTVSALRQYNAAASLETSERKIKVSKRFCIVEVPQKLGHRRWREDHESSKEAHWFRPQRLAQRPDLLIVFQRRPLAINKMRRVLGARVCRRGHRFAVPENYFYGVGQWQERHFPRWPAICHVWV